MFGRTAVVTGCAGFVGCHLVERLLNSGRIVYGVDNFYTGTERNIAPYRHSPRFHFLEMDVLNEELPYRLAKVCVDEVFHLACPASPIHYQRDPLYTLRTCYEGTTIALRIRGISPSPPIFLFTSTSEVYGDPEVHPQPETYHGSVNPQGPRSCYDEGKRVAETLVYLAAQRAARDVRIARLFNTYGPRMQVHDGRVVSNFIVAALKGRPLSLHGQGHQTRSFTYIDDTVEGLLRLMEHRGGKSPVTVNLGNPEELRVIDFAELVLSMTQPEKRVSPITMHPDLPDDPRRRLPDISRARERLGWQPRIPIREGLERTIAYFRKVI